MRAWAVVENGAPLEVVEVAMPEPAGTEVLVEVTHCGVCHSDLHIWEGYYELGGGKRMSMRDRGIVPPVVMGHEIVGRVAKLGPDAAGVSVGDRRVVYPWVGCGTCAMCRAERDNLCPNGRAIGIYQHGGYGSHVLVPHPRHLVDPQGVDPALAATYACSGITVYSAIRQVMPLPPEEPIVLIGAGGLGLNAIAVLRAMGHQRIVSVDISPGKRAAALAAGATEAVEPNAAAIRAGAGGDVLAVIDMVNGTATAEAAFAVLRKGGKMVQVGLFGGAITVALPVLAMRALSVTGSYVGTPADLRDLIALAETGRLAPLPVEVLPRDSVNEALGRLRDGRVTGRLVLAGDA